MKFPFFRRPTQRQINAALHETIRQMQAERDEFLAIYNAEVKRSRAKHEQLSNRVESINRLQGHHNSALIGHQVIIDRIVEIQEGILNAKIAFIDKPQPHPSDIGNVIYPRSFANTNTPQGAL